MDLSRLKWPLLVVIIVGIGFLASSPGIDYMVNKFTAAQPGVDIAQDATDEAGLSRVAGYLMYMFRFERALEVLRLSMDRYGKSSANYWNNRYREAQCLDRLKRYKESYDVLQDIIRANASQIETRVPNNDILRTRAEKLKAVHGL